MRNRSRFLIGAAAVILAGVLLLVELLPRARPPRSKLPEPEPRVLTQVPPAPPAPRKPPAPKPVPKAAKPKPAKPKSAKPKIASSKPKPSKPAPAKPAPSAPAKEAPSTPEPAKPAPSTPAKQAPAAPARSQPAVAATQPPSLPEVKPAPTVVETDPGLIVASPRDGGSYSISSITVSGRVTGSEHATDARDIESLFWAIEGMDRTGQIPFAEDGSFSALIPLDGIHTNVTLLIQAHKKNGRSVERRIVLHDQGERPALAVSSPAEGSFYGQSVTVEGSVKAPDEAGSPTAELTSASWSIAGTDQAGILQPDADGAFSFTIASTSFHGDLSVIIRAVDRNGRESSITRTLKEQTAGPKLRIVSPADRSPLGDSVTIEGVVGDTSDPAGSPSLVKKLSWRAIGRPTLAGDIPFDSNGDFSVTVRAPGLTDDLVLEIIAEDGNGRSTRTAMTLVHQAAPAPRASAAAVQPVPPPTLTVASPAYGGSYRSSVEVTGTAHAAQAADSSAPASSAPISVSWTISGTSLAGKADVSADGTFDFTVPTAGLHGTQALKLRAAQGDSRAADLTLVLYQDTRGLPLQVTSPVDGGYYQATTILEGKVGDESLPASGELDSLSWKIPSKKDMSGHAVVNADGRFRLAIPFSDFNGDVTIALIAADKSGNLTQKNLMLHDGTQKPGLSVGAPADGSAYGSLVRVAGKVSDPYAGIPGMAGIKEISWLLAPTDYSRKSVPVRGTVELKPDNTFRFSIPTEGVKGPQQLTLTVRASNGNESDAAMKLPAGEGDLPGFTVDPSDRTASVTWQKVPFAVRYDLTYGPAGGPAAARRTVSEVSPPFSVTGLENGSLYEFHVAVAFDDGGSGSSITAQAIPLAPATLSPVVKGDYQQIRLSWKTIPGSTGYDVWRSLSRDTGYTKIAPALNAARYVDTAVQFGRDYFYAISPSSAKGPLSAPGVGRTLAFPEDKLALLGAAAVAGSQRITIDGGYAFVAAGEKGVSIVDVSDPKAPVTVGHVATRDAQHVAVRGEYAYVADGEAGLRVLDVSNPHAPEILGSCKTSDARAVALAGRYAFVADGAKGLKVVDVSDARNLPRVAIMETTDAQDLVMSGDVLYLADGPGGLKVINVAKPRSPVLLASLATADARGVDVQSGTAVVADGAQGLHVVNVRNPAKPVLASTFETEMAASVATDGRFAYLTDAKGSIRVVDIKDPAKPSLFTAHSVNGPVSVSVEGRHAYIADAAGLEIMRIQIYGRSFRVASCDAGGKAFRVAVNGPWAYVAAHAQGLRVVNIRDPSQVTSSSAVASAAVQYAESVAVQDKLAFVAGGNTGVRILDVSPAWADTGAVSPREMGSYRTGGFIYNVAANAALVFAANGRLGLRILDVSDPSAPVEVGSLRTTDARDVAVRSSVAWIADGDAGLRTIDVTDPANPVAAGEPIPGNATSLALNGSLLIAGGTGGVRIFDVTNPRAPKMVGRYDSDSVGGVSSAGRYVYVAEGFRGLTVLDVSRPSQPVVVSSCADVFAMSVAVSGDYALATDSFGLRVIRILIPDWLSH